jgi:toxin ParE1/3/4
MAGPLQWYRLLGWYDRALIGLGGDFLQMVDRAIGRIERTPQSGSPAPGVEDAAIHRASVRRFPYHVVYIVLPDRVQVLAVAHQRRRPQYWMEATPTPTPSATKPTMIPSAHSTGDWPNATTLRGNESNHASVATASAWPQGRSA